MRECVAGSSVAGRTLGGVTTRKAARCSGGQPTNHPAPARPARRRGRAFSHQYQGHPMTKPTVQVVDADSIERARIPLSDTIRTLEPGKAAKFTDTPNSSIRTTVSRVRKETGREFEITQTADGSTAVIRVA